MDKMALSQKIIAWRRALHQIPEVGFDLTQTTAYVQAELEKLGLAVTRVCNGSGLTALIEGDTPGKTVALRADMDALPIREETGLPFASTNGNMHACGHDGHTAMLLGAAALLCENRESIQGKVKLIFQPAEENLGGARDMVADGVLVGVDALFGMHAGQLADAKAGTFSFKAGASTASFDAFDIVIHGAGSHGARPEDGVDPIVVAANLINTLQTLASREHRATDPYVFSIGSIHGGETFNIIPDEVTLKGCMRACDGETRERLKARVTAVVEGVCAAMRAKGTVTFHPGYLPTVNDAACTKLAHDKAADLFGGDSVEWMELPIMVSEDVSEYLARVPGCFWLYATPGKSCRHHSATFDLDETLLWRGSVLLAETAKEYLAKGVA
ncbi:MAG: M20 family metallopeptidase [Clostridiaceae bacterium]|nr:M20 family metallopeptidase [Clostridiaceae bacterium]